MADIAKCDNEECPLKKNCYRYTVEPDEYWQSYSNFQFVEDEDGKVKCAWFWDNKGYKNGKL